MILEMLLFLKIIAFGFSSTVAQTSGSLKYFDNYNTGILGYGPKETILDYVELTNDPVSNLPEDFTVCSSLYIKYMTTKNNVLEFGPQETISHYVELANKACRKNLKFA